MVGERARLRSAREDMLLVTDSALPDKTLRLFPDLRHEQLSKDEMEHPTDCNLAGRLQCVATVISEKVHDFGRTLDKRGGPDLDELHQGFFDLLKLVALHKALHCELKTALAFYRSCRQDVLKIFKRKFRSVEDFMLKDPAVLQKIVNRIADSLSPAEVDSFLHVAATPVADERWKVEHSEMVDHRECCLRNFAISVFCATRTKSGLLPECPFTLEFVYW